MRQRVTDVRSGKGSELWLNNHKSPAPPDVTRAGTLQESHVLLESQGNAFRKLGKTSGRIGGDFRVFHHNVLRDITTPFFQATDDGNSTNRKRFSGHLTASVASFDWFDELLGYKPQGTGHSFPNPVFTPKSELDAWGSTVIANVEPTNPLAGLTVTLGELRREGLPSLPGIQALKGKTSSAKKAGGEYLNKEFGWDPLIGDVRKIMHSIDHSQELIDQYERNSGRKVKREYHPPEETTTITYGGTGHDILHPSGFAPSFCVTPPKWSVTETTVKRRWFEGTFTYFLPSYVVGGNNWERNRHLAYKLYGVGITPEVVWDLTPWTWAADWFGNTGDVLHNIGAFASNGLVMPYGYVMEEISIRYDFSVWDIRTISSEPPFDYGWPQRMSCHTSLETVSRQRRTATPYGFGLNFDGFNSFQLSILGALGLSRRG